jgi:hypothetical protein
MPDEGATIMSASDVNKIYEEYIKRLSSEDRRRLLTIMERDLAEPTSGAEEQKLRSIMELEGLGAELWEGVDPQEYVDELRSEWDHRP